MVLYNYRIETTPITQNILGNKQPPRSYSVKLWSKIPIRYLLIVIDVRRDQFQHLRAKLFQFIAASMPHMLPTIDSVLNNMDEHIACIK